MVPAVLMLYGPHGQHPWQEDMFFRPDKIQISLQNLGFGLDVAMVTQTPSGKDEIPDVRIARNPVYDQQTGVLREANFCPGTIEDYPSIIDHWVDNFRAEVPQLNGTSQRTAFGIGLSADRLWNHKDIQRFGNRKDLMYEIIANHGVGIDTYNVLDYGKFAAAYGSERALLYKPQGGSRGKGIEIFNNIGDLVKAVAADEGMANGFIQPYLQNANPIQGVIGATFEDSKLLKELNSEADRPREIRMHVITMTGENGELQTEAYPIMKISEPHRKFLKYQVGIGIDPSCLSKGTFIYDKSVEMAQAVCRVASTSKNPIPQYYGAFDWLIDGDVHDPQSVHVVDGNCRGPGLPECAVSAREAFERMLVQSGKKHLV